MMKRKPLETRLFPLGMVGVFFYLAHTLLGNVLWESYNPITMDISTLTAEGAPYASGLKVLSTIYAVCMLLMCGALVKTAFQRYHLFVRAGYALLLAMQMVSFIGYSLFPLTADKTAVNFQNTMHLAVTGIVVFTTIASSVLLAYGYLKQEKMRFLGRALTALSMLILLFGGLNPIGMALNWNVLGLTERLVIYTIQSMLFLLSYYYTFKYKQTPIH